LPDVGLLGEQSRETKRGSARRQVFLPDYHENRGGRESPGNGYFARFKFPKRPNFFVNHGRPPPKRTAALGTAAPVHTCAVRFFSLFPFVRFFVRFFLSSFFPPNNPPP